MELVPFHSIRSSQLSLRYKTYDTGEQKTGRARENRIMGGGPPAAGGIPESAGQGAGQNFPESITETGNTLEDEQIG